MKAIRSMVLLLSCAQMKPASIPGAGQQQHTITAREAHGNPFRAASRVEVRSKGQMATATVQEYSQTPKQIALILDAGPNQLSVLSREKELAAAIVSEMSSDGPQLTVGRAAHAGTLYPTTADRALTIDTIRNIAGEAGEKSSVPTYDLIGSAIRELSTRPGIRVLIFIGEGNDSGSKLRYKELRNMAEAHHVACFVALIADHPLRGSKSLLRYGWWLQKLAEDTAGLFLENNKPAQALRQVAEGIRALRLLVFEMPFPKAGRYNISTHSPPNSRFRAQKALVIGAAQN